MNKMKRFLLLVLSLLTGREASLNVKGCTDGWAEFTCICQKPKTKCKHVEVFDHRQNRTIQSTLKDVWENKGRLFFYHDTKKVVIKQLEQDKFGECKSDTRSNRNAKKQQLKVEVEGCLEQFTQTVYTKVKTNIICDNSGNKHSVNFFCKDNGFRCEDILPKKSSSKSNGRFTLTDNNSNIFISEVSSQDAGVYWCGVNRGNYYRALRKIQLKVENIRHFTKSPTIGQTFTYWCEYKGTSSEKFICKGEDPSICETVVTTQSPNNKGFSMKDNTEKKNLTITLREVTANDSGTYWCGAGSTDQRGSKTFFHRFVMKAGTRTSSPVPSTKPTTSAANRGDSLKSQGGFSSVIIVVGCVTLLLLLFVPILVLFYKRFSCSKNTRNGAAAQQISEDYIYEEIQERPQKPDDATMTTYATNPSASLCYSTVDFKNSSDKAGGETLLPRPASTACEYSTVVYSDGPTIQIRREPLYSTVNDPQKQPGQLGPDRK